MDIDELSPRQKSDLLIGLVGWHWEEDCPRGYAPSLHDENHRDILTQEGGLTWDGELPDLYQEANMYLAWRVALWCNLSGTLLPDGKTMGRTFQGYCLDHFLWGESGAQGAWLDKALQLAIAAGLVNGSAAGKG